MKLKYRPQLIIACVFMILQQFDGINAIIVSPSSVQPQEQGFRGLNFRVNRGKTCTY